MKRQAGIMLFLFVLCSLPGFAGGRDWETLMIRADSLYNAQNRDSAIVVGNEALSYVIGNFGASDTNTAKVLLKLGIFTYRNGDYARAESLLASSYSILATAFDPGRIEIFRNLYYLGNMYRHQGRYAQAESLLVIELSIADNYYAQADIKRAYILNELGNLHSDQSDYREAARYYERSLHIKENQNEPDQASIANALNNLGNAYYKMEKYDDAIRMHERALIIRKEKFGLYHHDVALSLNNMARVYEDLSMYTISDSLYRRALHIYEKVFPPDHPDRAMVLSNLALVNYQTGDYEEAVSLNKKARSVYESAYGQSHAQVARVLGNQAEVYMRLGDCSEAETLCNRAQSILIGKNLHNHDLMARTLTVLGLIYWSQGRYAEAEIAQRRAYDIKASIFGSQSGAVAANLHNIAIIYKYLGKHEESEKLYRQAFAIWKDAYGLDHRLPFSAMANIANSCSDQKRYREAESLYVEALNGLERIIGTDNLEYSNNLNNLGHVYWQMKEYDRAESTLKQSLAINEKKFGTHHPMVATNYMNLGNLYREQGKLDKAQEYLSKALQFCDHPSAPSNPEIACIYESACLLHRAKNEYAVAHDLSKRANTIRIKNWRDSGFILSENEALLYSQLVRLSTSLLLSCYFDMEFHDADDTKYVYDVLCSLKGPVSDEIFDLIKSAIMESDPKLKEQFDRWRDTRRRYAHLSNRGPQEESIANHRNTLDSLSLIIENLELSLARHRAEFRVMKQSRSVSADDISKLLPDNSVLVEYHKYNHVAVECDTATPRYLALVVDSKGSKEIIELGLASPIDAAISEYRAHMRRMASRQQWPREIDKDTYGAVSSKIYRLIFAPLEGLLKDDETIFVAPDGELNLVSFSGLMNEYGQYLIEKFAIQYLAAGRDLVRLQYPGERAAGLFALGDPDYNAMGENPSGTYENLPATRNIRSCSDGIHEIFAVPLPHTRTEIQTIAGIWNTESSEPVITFFGLNASEDNFKKHAPRKRVVHLVTHGYYLADENSVKWNESAFAWQAPYIGENPLLFSGLLFAGANLHGGGADSLGIEDGILSAYEVSGMDLSGTDLVVLSACESGLGAVLQGEGVYGLRRAFLLAGARTVVCALWPVSDETTADMMGQLYSSSKASIPQHVRNVQLKQIKKLRKEGRIDHPYTWAGFIAIGDWK